MRGAPIFISNRDTGRIPVVSGPNGGVARFMQPPSFYSQRARELVETDIYNTRCLRRNTRLGTDAVGVVVGGWLTVHVEEQAAGILCPGGIFGLLDSCAYTVLSPTAIVAGVLRTRLKQRITLREIHVHASMFARALAIRASRRSRPRIAGAVLALVSDVGRRLNQDNENVFWVPPVTHREIAMFASVTRETVSKDLRTLPGVQPSRDGLVVDVGALRRFVDP